VPSTDWVYRKVECRMEIDGKSLPIVGVRASWDLNGIPVASVSLPLGRDTQSLKPSEVHLIATALRDQLPAKVYARLDRLAFSPGGKVDLGIPEGEFLLFDGLTAGVGDTMAIEASHAEFTLQLTHKLSELNNSSCFSDSSHPRNPTHYSYGALMPDTRTGARHWTGSTLAAPYVDQGKLKEDLWGSCLYPFFQNLTEVDAIFVDEVGLKGSGKNDGAAAGLALLAPTGDDYKKLGVGIDFDNDLASKIMQDISLTVASPDDIGSFTFWDLIVGRFAQDYMFSVVTRTKGGLIVPFVPGYRKEFDYIPAGTYNVNQSQLLSERPFRAMGILSQISSRLGVVDQSMDAIVDMGLLGVGGWFEPREKGMVQIRQGPRWMGSLLSASRFAGESSGGKQKLRGTTDSPGAGTAPADLPRDKANDRVRLVKRFLDEYAKTAYAIETLRDRQASISCPFRLDIAPGSTVKIEGSSEAFIANDALGANYFGTVLRVSVYLDAESGMAGTAYHIGYMRNEEENTSDETSIEKHPLYNETFSGCKLVET